jgi:DNA-binding FadR family transcriptional regulator
MIPRATGPRRTGDRVEGTAMLGGSRTDDGHRLMLVDCIAVGDTDEAAKVMRAHIDTSLGATAGWRLGTTPLGE